MKKMGVLLFLTVAALHLSAQGTSPSQAPAPNSQSVGSSSKTASNDGELTQELQSRFAQDPAFVNVQVSVADGTATITGSVPAKADKKRAKDLAKSVVGVKHVKEDLTVNPSSGSSPGSKDNGPKNASIGSGNPGSATTSSAGSETTSNSNQTAASAPTSTNQPNGETSATSNNPKSQASSATGAATTSGAAAANPATGNNASSLPQSTGSEANENNMAGQGPVNGQSASTTPTTTGGVTGAVGAPANTTQSNTKPAAIGANAGGAASTTSSNAAGDLGVSINDSATLQNQIQTALQNEPTLRNDNVNATVTESTIELSGNVQNSRAKQTARRIASSFAGNRRVRDRITLSGSGSAANNPNSSGLGSNPASNTNPNPNSNPNAQNPSANNPKANGDASVNPR